MIYWYNTFDFLGILWTLRIPVILESKKGVIVVGVRLCNKDTISITCSIRVAINTILNKSNDSSNFKSGRCETNIMYVRVR